MLEPTDFQMPTKIQLHSAVHGFDKRHSSLSRSDKFLLVAIVCFIAVGFGVWLVWEGIL